MPRESRRQSYEGSDRRKPDRERDRDPDRERDTDRDRDRRRDRDVEDTHRRRESDSNYRTRSDYAPMPNPPSFTNMPYAAPSSPPRQYSGPYNVNTQGNQRRRAPSNSSYGSSSSSSVLDISRHYPQSRYGGFLGTFFKAPSERRRRNSARRAARSSKRRTSFYFGGAGNSSSSSSVNSDLAYGYGYIPKLHRRRRSSRRDSGGSNSFQYGGAAAAASGSGSRSARTRDGDVPDAPPSRRPDGHGPTTTRGKTDEEILDIGRQLSDLARKQNKHDLKAAGYVKPTMLAAAAAAGLGKYRKSRNEARSRGVGSSRIHGESSSDESDWEDASDDESDGADSVLAYGSVVSSAVRPTAAAGRSSYGAGPYASGAVMGGAGAAAAAALADPQRRSSVVDPRLFGPVNSLRGMINTPCGFGQDPHPAPPPVTYQTPADARRNGAEPLDRRPMREVYPVPTSDPSRFDADAIIVQEELPHRSHTSTVPLEQPVPKLPVSSKVYEADKLEGSSRRESRHGKDRDSLVKDRDSYAKDRDSHGFNGSTVAGFAAAAIGATGVAALASDRKEDKKEKKALRERERERERDKEREREDRERERAREKDRNRDKEREQERERDRDRRDRDRELKRRDKDSDKEGKKSKRDSYSSSKYDEKDHKRHSKHADEDTPRKRRETEADHYADSPSRKDRSKREIDEPRSELSRSSKRDSNSYSSRDDRKEDKGKSVDRYDFSYNQGTPSSKVNPFLYQVSDGAFSTTVLPAVEAPADRPLTPNIVTIDREPNFDDYEPYLPLEPSESRLSRKDSFEIQERPQDFQVHPKRYDHGIHVYEEGEHEASSIYDQAKHATIPVAAAAVASAIAVETERSRERRRGQYDEEGSRDRGSWRRDTVQEEADKYYRESVIARKIEEEQIRSRTPEDDASRQVRIVTPPEMHEQHKNVGPYDAPNADVRIDNQLFPKEATKFDKKNGKRKSNFKSRDPSCERDRPVLNLVFPTPIPSREPTPRVERQTTRDQRETRTRSDPSAEVAIGPKGDIIKIEPSNKSVSWGENSTKSFEVESADGRSDAEKEKVVEPEDKPRVRLTRASPWSMVAAAVAGSGSEPSGKPDTVSERKYDTEDYSSKIPDIQEISQTQPEQVYNVDTRDQPPVPGPKPISPPRSTLPGSFADDVEFAATLAAGLKDTGFDSNIVVDDPTYRRRDSPPGTKEANGDEWNHKSMSDIVMDIANKKDSSRSVVSEPAGITRDRPVNDHSNGGDEWEAPKKLSKKDKKKLDKLKYQSLDSFEPINPTETINPDPAGTPAFEDAVEDLSKLSKKEQKRREKQAKALSLLEGGGRDTEAEPAPEPEIVSESVKYSYPTEDTVDTSWEDSSSKKKKKKDRKSQEMAPEESITVPTDAFDDLQSLRKLDKDDTVSTAIEEWDTPSKSKRKSKSDKDDTVSTAIEEWDTASKSKRKSKSDRDESTRSVAESELSTSSKKSSKSKRRSGTEGDFDGYGSDRSKKSSRSKHREGEDGYGSDVSKKSSKSKRRSGTEGDFDGYGSDRSKKSSRSKHREGDDGYGSDRSKKSSRSKHREGDDGYGSDMSRKSSKSKRRSGAEGDFDYGSDIPSRRRSLFDDRDVSSVVSEARGDGRRREREKDRDRDRDRDRDGRSSSKRSSRNYDDDDDARSVVSVASAPGGIRKSKDSKRSSGLFASIFKRDDDKKEKESFLDNAGTLGAGVGLAGAAAIVAASVARSNATDRSGEAHKDDDSHQTSRVESYDYDTFDPEIAPRAIKPAIDPQYGDLLPLPPSEPGSPRSEPGDFPPLPDSRPDTPPEEHGMRRDQITHRRRRSTQETPVKSPSNTAIPLSLRLGQRPPSSPSGTFKSPPTSSSAQTSTAPDSTAKRASRGTSWDSSREFKPLYLLEHSRHGSAETIAKQEHLPALPPSISASEISLTEDNSPADFASSGLHIDTQDLPHSFEQHGGSQETTPRAEIKPQFPTHEEQGPAMDPNAVDSMSKDRSSYLLDSTPSSTKTTATLDSELSQSDPGSTPSKHRRSADIMPEITEDLTSADERFEDALDMPSAGSHRWSDDSVAMQDASEHHELAPDAELLTKEASAPAEESVAEPDEWAGLSAKQKKKLKKAKKAQSLNLSEPTAEPAAEPAADPVSDSVFEPAFEITSEPAPDSTSAPLSESVPVVGEPVSSMPGPVKDTESASPQGEAFEGPKKSKKGKKNKKKSQSLENDALEAASIVAGAAALGATVLATQPADNTESAADPQPDTKLVPSSEATDNHSVAEKYDTEPSSSTEAIDNNTCVADPMPDTEFSSSADTSKNLHTQTEHGLTEGKGLPTETEPSAKEAEPQELLTKTNDESTKSQQLDIQPEVDSKSLEELNTKELLEQETSLPLKELAAQATPVEAEISPEPQPDKTEDITADATDEWSTTSKVSKKDKKKKKKKSLVLDDVSPEPEPAAEAVQETPIATELEDNALSAKEQTTDITPTEATASSEPQLEKAEGTSVDAGDWWTSSASKSDKKKKKNRKQSVMLDDVPAEPEPAPEAKIEIPMVREDEGKALATELTASTTNVEQNQPEHSLADLAADPPTEAADTKTVDADAAWPVSTTSKKDKKKKKKSSLSIIDNAISAEEPASTTDDQPSVVKDTGKIESVSEKEPEQPAVLDVYNEKETSINPEDEFAVTPQDKKKKKKGKRKSVHFEPEPIFSPEPSFSPEEEVPAPEDQPKTSDAQDDAAVPTLSTQDTIVSAQDTVFDETRQDLTSADTTQTDSQPPTDLQNDTLDPDKKDEKDTSQDALSLVNDSASDKKETVSSKQIELHDVTLNTATAESDKNLDSIDVTPATVTAEGREKPDLADVTSAVATDKTEAESEDEWSRLISGNKAKEPEGDIVLASGLTDEPETIIDVSGMPNEDSEFEPKKETPSPTEPPLEEWPVATGKKGKKGKKNKKSTSSVSWGEPEAQLDTSAPTESTSVAIPEPETLSKSIDAETSMSRDLIAAEANEPITEQPAAEAPDEPAAADADILIPAKMSKKDKKKKKLADLQEAFVDTPKDATEVETAVPVDEMPVEPLDGGAETVKEESVEQADPVAPTLEPAPELESVPAQQEKTNQDDGSDEIVSKLSKKDKKKKKKKQASMDEPKDEPAGLAQPDEAVQITEPVLSTESVLPTTEPVLPTTEPVLSTELVESAESVQPSSVESTESIRAIEPQAIEPVTLTDPETHQAVSEAQVEAALETSAEQSSRESEQANTDKEPDGFSAKLSKKDKKKKKKKQSASAETEAATFEPLIPALGLEPQADILEPAASLDSQSGDAIYPQQENVDDDSGAFATKSAKGDKQSETGQSVQTDAPQDNVSPVEHDPLVKDDQPAEESAPETAALVTSVETNPTQAEVEPTVKMSKPESISQAATTVEPETEWGDLNTKLSKKDKKKAKKAAKEAISRTPEETLVEEPATEKTVEQPFDAVIATDSVEKPIESTEPSPQATTPEVESEKELSGLARKSSKKDKKKKKKSLSQAFSAFTDEAAAQGADEAPAEPVAETDVSKPDEMNSEPVAEPVIEPVIEPVSEPVAEPVVAPDAEPPAVTIAKLASDAPPGETKTEDVLGGLNNDLPEDKEKEGREQEATSETIELNPEVPAIESPKAEIQEIVPDADEKPDVKEVEPDNSWMAGLSKKEQKKLKKKGLTAAALGAAAAATGASMLVAETPETARDPEPRPPQDVKDEFNSSSASGTSETEARQFTANKMSKAEKKKAKKLGLKMYDIGESEPTTEEVGAPGSTAERLARELPPSEQPKSSWAEEMADNDWSPAAEVKERDPKTDTVVPAEEPAAAESAFSTSAPTETESRTTEDDKLALPIKKGKKGKKAKRQSTLDVDLETVPTEQPAEVPASIEPETAREDPVSEQTREFEVEWPAPEAEAAAAQGDAESARNMTPMEPSKADQPISLTTLETVEEDLRPESGPSFAEETITAPVAESPAEVADDDWAAPTRKKSKKGKKGKSAPLSDFEDTASKGAESVPDSAQVSTQPEPVPVVEDEWGTTAKKGKGKKGKKMSLLAWEDSIVEPSSSTVPVEAENAHTPVAITDNESAFVEEPAAIPDAAVQDKDDWAAPVKKKSKKDKKRQSTQESYTEAEAPTKSDATRDNDAAKESKRDDATTIGDERQERRFEEAVSVGEVERDDLPKVEMTRSVDDKFSSSDKKMTTKESLGAAGGGKKTAGRDSLEAVGAAAALTGGVAALAQMYGGGKKKKGKKSKIVDKRQPQGDDLFDDPAVWEGPDKKNVVEESRDETLDDGVDEFWGPSRPDPGPSVAPHTPVSTSFTESGDEWKETARQGVSVDDEFVESPILGRGDSVLPRSTPAGLLRRDTKPEEPAGGPFDEAPRGTPSRQLSTELSEVRSSPTRALPVVQELPEAEKLAATGDLWPMEQANRDSGFIPESPPRRRSPGFVDEKLRDSGVDSGDWREPLHMQTPEAHGRAMDKRLGPSPLNTPVLQEPPRDKTTTPVADPDKKLRRSNKDYGGLAAVAAGSAVLTAEAAHHGKGRDNDRRAVSDSHAAIRSGRAESTDSVARRSVSNTSLSRQRTPEPLKLRPESPGSILGQRSTATPTPPPLRRVDKRMSGDLRALRQQNNSTPPVANEARVRTKDMADVYDGFGEGRLGSPRSPTRPHSMRRRQSMQVLELESRVDQLLAENRLLTEARNQAEQNANRSATSVLSERDAEIDALKQSLQYLQNEVNRLTEVNEGLTSANAELANKDNTRYAGLAVHGDGTRSLEGPDGAPIKTLEEKDAEIASLREQLEAAKEQVREMQRQILASKAADAQFLNIRDEDYFDNRCQQLCSHVQQWVLRFSKFSDMRACRLTSEINDEKTIDRLDNAVLDGSDVDIYLNDRVKRRDIFMSMTMSMIWEFVFTRYLFGMDREQRQKLKSLEKLLTEVGPQNAVRQWRAVTLTLLAKRASFQEQRELDTEAVVQAIFQTLCKILPPPSNLENQIQSQLRRVMREAVDLSIAMRTQQAEYMMLPPLQPEYDADGELAATVQFNASMMNERNPQNKQTNEEIQADNSIVRIVLFPLVVKKGDDAGVGDDEIVVCPAQVLVAREHGRRHVTPSSDAGGASLLGAPSRLSVVTDAMLSQADSHYVEGRN
ncbi:hypothetical protein BB8028_0002g13920 [Beauveria bassiana]|uniref:Involucrin repeat protein n=1 Tax=Beauveria bassiana TaxID=176275 RepID=A0A2S7Y4V2_BEABA|nr:hypothetical protein BB8028_0002g13920 [Beauveria bassiana]